MSVLIAGVGAANDEFGALWAFSEGAGCDYASDCPPDEYCSKNVCSRSLGGLGAAKKKDKDKKGKKDEKPAESKAAEPKSESKPKEEGGGMLMPILLGVGALAVGVAGVWWWKRRR